MATSGDQAEQREIEILDNNDPHMVIRDEKILCSKFIVANKSNLPPTCCI